MKLWIKYFLLGAFCFWMPGVILNAIPRRGPGLVGFVLLNILPVVSLISAYSPIARWKNTAAARPSVAASMLLGIYILGARFVMVGNTFLDAGFHRLSQEDLWFLVLCFVPPVTWLMAGPQIFALIFVTFFLIFAHFRWERGRWVPLYSWHRKTKLNAPSS